MREMWKDDKVRWRGLKLGLEQNIALLENEDFCLLGRDEKAKLATLKRRHSLAVSILALLESYKE